MGFRDASADVEDDEDEDDKEERETKFHDDSIADLGGKTRKSRASRCKKKASFEVENTAPWIHGMEQ